MIYLSADDMLEGLDPTDEERLAFLEALDEQEAEEAGLPSPYDADGDRADPEDDGPGGSWADQLEAAGAALDARNASEADRVVADITDQLTRRPTDEMRAARALQRIEAGDYLPDPYSRGDPAAAAAARDPSGRWASACGPLDPEYARCAARYHDPSCHVVTEAAAANGSYEEAEAWADTLQHRTPDPGVTGFANESGAEPHDPLGVSFDDVLDDGSQVPYDRLRDQVLHRMGLSDRQDREPRGPRPDVRWAHEALGI